MAKLKLTKCAVDNIPFSQSGQIDYWDTELKGFGITVGKTTKTYFAMRRVNGKRVRTTIDRHNAIPLKKARDRAAEILVEMKQGVNPNLQKKVGQQRGMTLQRAFDEYVRTRKPKESTLKNDISLLNCHLSDWLNKPIADITRDMVVKRHQKLLDSNVGSNASNNVFRMFRRVYNCINAKLDNALPPNPVDKISEIGQWAKVGRRQTIIADSDLPSWYRTVRVLDNPYVKNYLLILLFTGMRKEEGLSLEWQNINMADKTIKLPETKNGKQLILPMSNYLQSLFVELHNLKQGDYVFPSSIEGGKSPHMWKPTRQINKVKKESGVEFCVHDLRRVFKTVAADTVSTHANHRLTNHISKNAGDGYVIMSLGKVREPMQAITDKLLILTGAWSDI